MAAVPVVDTCESTDCSYNHDGCTAFAMTMADEGCATFIDLGTRGGLDRVTAKVGACQRADCAFNENLECSADAVRVGAGDAECLTFTAR
ncbi:MAG: hypothetical protein Q4P36_09050 [Bowdeniella nasicola]|nr:hypothetical protein [Bowdeniella nasicola]